MLRKKLFVIFGCLFILSATCLQSMDLACSAPKYIIKEDKKSSTHCEYTITQEGVEDSFVNFTLNSYTHTAVIGQLTVHKDHRLKGYGKALFTMAMHSILKKGYTDIALLAEPYEYKLGTPEYIQALKRLEAFYSKHGFVVYQHDYYHDPEQGKLLSGSWMRYKQPNTIKAGDKKEQKAHN